jgi:hypothetical protein
MKKTLTVTTLALLAGAVSVFAQGQLSIGDGPDAVGFGIFVFGLQASGNTQQVSYGGFSGSEKMGNAGTSSYDTSPGTAAFTGAGLSSANYSVELLAGPASSTAVSQLAPVGPIVNSWYTGALAGLWHTGSIDTVPTVAIGSPAAVAIAAWFNGGNPLLTLAQAQAAGDAWGVSSLAVTGNLGGGTGEPPSLPAGLESFSLAVTTPEPSTIALGVIGASALLFRRKK